MTCQPLTESELRELAELEGLSLAEYRDWLAHRPDLNHTHEAIRADLAVLNDMIDQEAWETQQEHALADGAGSDRPSMHRRKGER